MVGVTFHPTSQSTNTLMVDLLTGQRRNAKTTILRFSRDKIHVS
jgi:hypothetical protein